MAPAVPLCRAGPPRPRPWAARRGLALARLPARRLWRCWALLWGWLWDGLGLAAPWLRLARARRLPGPAGAAGAAGAAASSAASPARAPPLASPAAGSEPPLPAAAGEARPGPLEGRSGAVPGPGPNADGHVSPARKAKEPLHERYRLHSLLGSGGFGRVYAGTRLADGAPVAIKAVSRDGIRRWGELPDGTRAPLEIVLLDKEPLHERYRLHSLLGSGGFGRVYAGTRLADGAPVAIKAVSRDGIRRWGELPDGTRAPLEIVLLDKVCNGFPGVIQLLEWFELPNGFLLVMERPEPSQDLSGLLTAWGFLPEEMAWGLFRQVLQAVRHCTSCGVLHRDIKPHNILLHLATGEAKLLDFGCGTFLQDTAYTQFAGTLSYSPPEWIYLKRYHGEEATIWSLGILLYQMVCGKHPFCKGTDTIWDQLPFPARVSPGCQDLIRWCLSIRPSDRPALEDLLCHPWVQGIPLP
ncbi:serine/threonine-protein kinase pim-1-like isoform X1 [Manacus candei]|uniref:serine/threonine-protein kinase pim-1-like isoform X1 n=1 Tax=Manacus candei TaxID=415023 RepID=UPI002227E15A|nr:serine/threonine-protein kinase pim-1-like isoform X1 [Manacus candei]